MDKCRIELYTLVSLINFQRKRKVGCSNKQEKEREEGREKKKRGK